MLIYTHYYDAILRVDNKNSNWRTVAQLSFVTPKVSFKILIKSMLVMYIKSIVL